MSFWIGFMIGVGSAYAFSIGVVCALYLVAGEVRLPAGQTMEEGERFVSGPVFNRYRALAFFYR